MFKEVALLFHTPIGKSTQARAYTAAANYRYITRQQATDYAEHHLMPGGYKSAQDWLRRHERSIRSNGRVVDKMVVVFPIGMAQPHAVEALRSFMGRVSDERAPYVFTLQNFEPGEVNPHAHVIFVDRDAETGRRVFGTSERGSSDRLRSMWMEDANQVLEREGYEFRLGMHRDAPRQQLEPDEEDVQHSREEIVMPKTPQEVRDRVKHALSYQRELDEVRMRLQNAYTLETNMRQVQDSVERAKDELIRRREYAATRERAAARAVQELAEHTKPNGNLKGFRVPLVGWKSPARHAAEHAEEEAREARELESHALIQLENHKDYLQREERDAAELESQFRQINGTQQDMRLAEQVFEKEADRELNGWEEDQDGTIVKHQALEPQEIWALVETMDISEDEARELFKQMGATEHLLMLDRGQEIE